jgi:hypothetical protein
MGKCSFVDHESSIDGKSVARHGRTEKGNKGKRPAKIWCTRTSRTPRSPLEPLNHCAYMVWWLMFHRWQKFVITIDCQTCSSTLRFYSITS